MFYYGLTIWANDRYSPEYHDLHFDLGFAGCFLSTLAVVSDSICCSIIIMEIFAARNYFSPSTLIGKFLSTNSMNIHC